MVGERAQRIDARGAVTGGNRYGADLFEAGMLCGRYLRSPYARARIVRVDVSRATALPGVQAVVTAQEYPQLFASDEVYFQGQRIAAVAAETWELAEEALQLIEVEYEPLPAVPDLATALRPSSPRARPEAELQQVEDRAGRPLNNVARADTMSEGDVETALREAAVVADLEISMPVVHQLYIEPHVATARVEPNGHVTVWSGAQGLFAPRRAVAQVLGLPLNQVTVIGTQVGGAFGGKLSAHLEPLAAVLARQTGKTVQVRDTREEVFRDSHPGPAFLARARMGCRADGRLVGLDAEVFWNGGISGAGGPSSRLLLQYELPCYRILSCGVYTNTLAPGAYRAPGSPNTALVRECLVDELARGLGLDPLEFRLRNLKASDPGAPQRSWLRETLTAAAAAYGWTERRETIARLRQQARGPHRPGIGLAVGQWNNWVGTSVAYVKLNEDGTFEVVTGSVDITGAHTSLVQIAAQELEVPMHQVSLTLANTSTIPYHDPSGGSRTTYASGLAVQQAAQEVKRKMLALAARELERPAESLVYHQGKAMVETQPDLYLTAAQLGQLSAGQGPILGVGSVTNHATPPAYSVCMIELTVDTETGAVALERIFSALDMGRAINPTSVEGQVQGGVLQGIGIALWEGYVYDAQARLLNPNLTDYRIGTSLDTPPIEVLLLEYGCPQGPFEAKGVGEPPIIPPAAAVANAVCDALGVRITHLPLTPERIVRALRS